MLAEIQHRKSDNPSIACTSLKQIIFDFFHRRWRILKDNFEIVTFAVVPDFQACHIIVPFFKRLL